MTQTPNHLAGESSPYLLEHAYNPVDWYPWGPEAFALAQERDSPILISIGYSACHWCHVMARESFEDPDVARLMNEHFVNIKVDREERPDVDAVYMNAVQAMTGQGGWPLTAFLTPQGVPFQGGTYFPPLPRPGLPSFTQVLEAVAKTYTRRREGVEDMAEEVRRHVDRAMVGVAAEEEPGPDLLTHAHRVREDQFDAVHGGFGGAPKFPQSSALESALRYHLRTGDQAALGLVTKTLDAMARGGIRDHLGGGFHRYTVDRSWHVPHFEKMLYDNALLARVYLQAFQVTGSDFLKQVCESTLDYLLTDMRSPTGMFYSARDADSEGVEGQYYVWRAREVDEILGATQGEVFRAFYDVRPEGNWEGSNILRLVGKREPTGLAEMRSQLLEARARRVAPARDEKILTGWNGLAIRAFAEAGAALGRVDYLDAARRAAGSVLHVLSHPAGGLLHSAKGDATGVGGFLDDYGSMGNALLSLHEGTLEERWLTEACTLGREIVARFWNEESGLFFDTAHDAEQLMVRPRTLMDSPTPSGTSLAAELLQRLAVVLDEEDYRRITQRVLRREGEALARFPTALGHLLGVLDFQVGDRFELVIVGDPAHPGTQSLLDAAHEKYHPAKVVVGLDPAREPTISSPLLRGRALLEGSPAAYLCRGYTCQVPVSDAQELRKQLSG